MTVIPIGHQTLTPADIAVLMDCGDGMVEQGHAGACVQLDTPEGEMIVAILDPLEEHPLWVFGKSQGWYYVLDDEFHPIAQGQLIEEILAVLPNTVTERAVPALANYA